MQYLYCLLVLFILLLTTQIYAEFVPMSIAPDKVVSVHAGALHSAMLSKSGVVYTFGSSIGNRLGLGAVTGNYKIPTAVTVPDNKKIVQMSIGSDSTFLVASDGSVYGFGSQTSGKLGTGVTVNSVDSPTLITIPGNKKIIKSSAGTFHSILLAEDGTVFTFGSQTLGKLGDNAGTGANPNPTAITIPDNKKIVDIAAGASHSVLVAEDGTVFTFGGASNGVLCNNANSPNVQTPTAITIPDSKKIVKGRAGSSSTLLIAEDGTAFVCGSAISGQLGNSQQSGQVLTPTALTIPDSKKIVDGTLSKTSSFSALMAADGTLFMFGNGAQGKLGSNANANLASPTAVPIIKKIVGAGLGQNHTVVVASDGTVYGMGSKSVGVLGNGEETNSPTSQMTPLEVVSGVIDCECNGHGTCDEGSSECNCTNANFNATDHCASCLEGYAGENCTEIICDGISSENTTAVCSGHGQCVSPDVCECDSGWKIDAFCGVTSCFNRNSDSANACSGRGKCVELNYCRCSQGYGGYKCQRDCSYCYKNYRL